jgi:recombination protein RecT
MMTKEKQIEEMAKKTVLKRILKYAPLKSDFIKGVAQDESIKTSISEDMYEVTNDIVYDDTQYNEVDTETGEVKDGN